MNWRLVRSTMAAAVAAIGIIGNSWFNERLGALLAQASPAPARMPGPIIEDPPGSYVGQSFVHPSSNLVVPTPQLSTITVSYVGFPPQAQAAFQAAINIWATQLTSAVPIRVEAHWTPLGTNVLGSAGPTAIFRDFPGTISPGTWFPVALANKMSGTDLDPSNVDIIANFNSTFDWYFGTDGNAGAKFDLMSVVLHELGHGLGFFGSMSVDGGVGSWGFVGQAPGPPFFPAVYDLFAINGASQVLLNTSLFPNPSTALTAQLIGNSVFFSGVNAGNANGGFAARLYAPFAWSPGSSYSHLNEDSFPAGNINSLMTPAIGPGEAIHDPGPVTRGMFIDMGWTVSVGCSYALSSSSAQVSSAASTGSVNVVTSPGCAWNAVSNSPLFLTITSAASGFGNGTVSYSVKANSGVGRSGTLTIAGRSFTVTQAARAASGDFDGDLKADVTIFRPSTGVWYILQSSTNFTSQAAYTWGFSTDRRVPGDYDGDGRMDIAIYRPSNGTWYILQSSSNFTSAAVYTWGLSTDTPVPGDYDGDGKTDVAIYRPSNGTWYILQSSTNFTAAVNYAWGFSTDLPVPGDYDGDGKTDVAIYRPSNGIWYILQSRTNFTTAAVYTWGGFSTDIPVAADYDGDGRADVAVYRSLNGIWYILQSSTNFTVAATYTWGFSTDIPVPGDFDGDRKIDVAIYRPSNGVWYVLKSSTGLQAAYTWGFSTDIPVLKRP